MDSNMLLGVVIAAAAAAIIVLIAMLASARMREARLRRRFGPEYERALSETGSRRKAAALLGERAKRVEAFELKPLTEEERQRFIPAWQDIEAKFVEDPKAAVGGADQLIDRVLDERGYKSEGFDQRAADLSVNHAHAVQDYRAAHDIFMREADTEELRQAMLGYRSMFHELVAPPTAAAAPLAAAEQAPRGAPLH